MFGDEKENYPVAKEPTTLGATYKEPTLKQKLDLAVNAAEQKLKDAKRAKEILDKNPELEELINIINRQRY